MKINVNLSNKCRINEIIKFLISGGICFAIDYGTMIFFTEVLGVNYLLSAAFSFTLSVIINYIMSIYWVFDSANKKNRKTIIIFIGSSIVGLLLNQILMYFCVQKIFLDYRVAKIISTIIVMIWNYIAKRKAVYL